MIMVIIIGFFFSFYICWLTCRLWAVLFGRQERMDVLYQKFPAFWKKFYFWRGKYQHSRNCIEISTLNTMEKKWPWLSTHMDWSFKLGLNSIFHQWSVCVHMAQIAQAGFLRCWHHQWVPDGMWWKFWFGPFRPEVLTKMDGSFWPPLVESIATGIPLKAWPVRRNINSCYKFVRPGSHRPLSKW